MVTTVIIAFREFLEAFLLIGLFLGMDCKFKLKKKKEILLAALSGILFSLLLPIIVFFLSSSLQKVLSEKNADLIEGYFLIFSGFFLAYVIFALHSYMKNSKHQTITKAKQKMEQEIFDVSLFFTLVFFIIREGFEVALLITTISLFTTFWANIEGLLLGFGLASLVGLTTAVTYVKLPIKKVFAYTEYLIMVVGAAMVKNGITLLLANYFHIHLENVLPFSLPFLPSEETIPGHVMNNLLGLQAEMSILQVCIMGVYGFLIYFLFIAGEKKRTKIAKDTAQ